LFDDLLERRHHSSVMTGDSRFELIGEARKPECREVVIAEDRHSGVDDLRDLLSFGLVGQSNAVPHARFGRLVALIAAENKNDCGQQIFVLQQISDFEPVWRENF
ncbi:MAG: hypothetical protein ACKOEH_00795, partial [Actinomycetota bacterium]